MNQRRTLRDFETQWKLLLHRSTTSSVSAPLKRDHGNSDPFDCSSIAVPPTHVLADWVADDFVERWRELDQRKISVGVVACNEDDDDEEDPSRKRQKLPRWYEKHVRLPEQFDYATLRSAPPADDGAGARVVSLVDPSATTSYHSELWKLFAEIPTQKQLDERATADCQLPRTAQWHQEVTEARKHTTGLDGHALSRLRMNDRHDLPPLLEVPHWTKNDSLCGTIRFECLRQQLRRGSTPDSNRMVLEFLGSQTLLDFHKAVVELTDDELWRMKDCTPSSESDENGTTTGAEACLGNSNNAATPQMLLSSGYFFIEDTFYVTGPVDYTSPVLEWLQSGNERERKRRLSYLGMPDGLPSVKSMADTPLDEVACRLGVRYVHVHHGDIECAVFATDRRVISKTAAIKSQFPIIHDIWTPSYTVPECEACQIRPAVIATSTTCKATGGHRALCEACCRQLKLPVTAHDKIKRYYVWRGQVDLSAGASGDTLW